MDRKRLVELARIGLWAEMLVLLKTARELDHLDSTSEKNKKKSQTRKRSTKMKWA